MSYTWEGTTMSGESITIGTTNGISDEEIEEMMRKAGVKRHIAERFLTDQKLKPSIQPKPPVEYPTPHFTTEMIDKEFRPIKCEEYTGNIVIDLVIRPIKRGFAKIGRKI